MAQPNLEAFDQRGLLGKLEVTEGTDPTPVAGTDGILVINGTSYTEVDVIERDIDRAFFTNNPFTVGNKRAGMEGEVELFSPSNPGVGAAACDVILQTAGLHRALTAGSATITGKTRYQPASTAIKSGTFYWYHVDKHIKVTGARTQLSRLSMQIGNRAIAQFRTMGTYVEVEESALPAITVYTTVPKAIRHDNTVCYITNVTDAVAPLLVWAKELTIDVGNQLASKEYTSKKVNAISDRKGTFTLRIARTAKADFDPHALRDAGKIISAYMQTDELTGLYTQIGFRGQIEQVNLVDIDGDLGYELTGRCIASSSATAAIGDEMWVEFGDTTAAGTA